MRFLVLRPCNENLRARNLWSWVLDVCDKSCLVPRDARALVSLGIAVAFDGPDLPAEQAVQDRPNGILRVSPIWSQARH